MRLASSLCAAMILVGAGVMATQAVAAPAKCETRCVHAKAELDRAPGVGETAQVSFEITSDVDLKGVRIDADVPGIMRLERGS